MVGGYVAPENVVAFRDEFESVARELQSSIDDEGWRQEHALVTQKINEALTDAVRRGIGFVEASEIYSGSMGMMN